MMRRLPPVFFHSCNPKQKMHLWKVRDALFDLTNLNDQFWRSPLTRQDSNNWKQGCHRTPAPAAWPKTGFMGDVFSSAQVNQKIQTSKASGITGVGHPLVLNHPLKLKVEAIPTAAADCVGSSCWRSNLLRGVGGAAGRMLMCGWR